MNELSGRSAPRNLALAFAGCGAATLLLLANHPKGSAQDFAGLLREEAGDRLVNGLVHGGFILVLGVLIISFVLLARQLGPARTPMVVTVVTFCIGSAALMASMLLDGLVIPAIAARFVDIEAPEKLAGAKAVFVLCGTLISFLMSGGLAFQSVAMLSLAGLLFAGPPRRRIPGCIGLVAGTLLIVLLAAAPAHMATHVLLAGIVVLALWYFTLAAVLFGLARQQSPP